VTVRPALPWLTCAHQRAAVGPYAGVDLTPPPQAREMAAEALQGARGGVRARRLARLLASGDRLHPDDVRALVAGLERAHPKRGPEWALLGGSRARVWARAAVRTVERIDCSRPPSTLWSTAGQVTRSTPQTEAEKGHVWRSWLADTQRPTERAITRQWRTRRGGIFFDQAKRYADRLAAVLGEERNLVRRNVTRDELDAILMREAELAAILDQFDERVVERGLTRAFEAAARRLGEELDPDDLLGLSDIQIADMVRAINPVTEARIVRVIEAGTEAGASIAEIQAAIQRDAAFSPARALRVGRTETARVLSEGTDRAYVQAHDVAGARFRVQWLSSRDGAVRESHAPGGGLDGQTIDVGTSFVAPDGLRARGPGLFGRDSGMSKATAAHDCNCRCTTIPTDIGG